MSLADSRFKLLMYDELTAKKERAELKIKKLSFEIDLLRKRGSDDFDYLDKLTTQKYNHVEKLRNTELALEQLESDINGGASLNPFLEQDKVESQD